MRKLHQDAQRLLRPLLVVNPYARALTFRDDRTRTRRDHLKYLTLIRALALLHQHQRPLKHIVHKGEQVEYVEATLEAFQYLQLLRLRQQSAKAGAAPNRIDPYALNEIEQRMLKEAFRQAKQLQDRLRMTYRL